jgi:hypothetical protein
MYVLIGKDLALDPNLIATHPEFKDIWDRDQTADKAEAQAIYTFIYHFINPKSFFHGLAKADRQRQIIEMYFPKHMQKFTTKGKKPNEIIIWDITKDKLVTRAMDGYVKWLNFAPERFLLDAAEEALHETAKKLNNPKEKNKESLLSTLESNTQKVRNLRSMVFEEELKKQLTTGDREISPREDSDYKPLFIPKKNLRQIKAVEDALR